jgi:hypothetical protein
MATKKRATKKKATKKKATKKKAVKKTSRKRCEKKPCRRLASPGLKLCAKCEKDQQEAQNPTDAVMKISAVRALKWDVLETKLRNHGQGVQLISQEMDIANRDFQAEQAKRKAKKEGLLATARQTQAEYKVLTHLIASEFGLDPTRMSIDPDTGVVHDLRKDG